MKYRKYYELEKEAEQYKDLPHTTFFVLGSYSNLGH